MRKFKGYICITMALTTMALAGCSNQTELQITQEAEHSLSGGTAGNKVQEAVTSLSQIDMTKWQYQAEDDVYYQIGIQYCETPADLTYETLSIFVPGKFMTATDNGNGTFTCSLNMEEAVGNYTAETAPIVMPVETPGYMAAAALTEYRDFSDYTDQGFIYVYAGCRGRDQGAPAGVTDLKAAIRYIRYNEGVIAGDMNRIFSFGMSGGGAQSALLGATGDSTMYDAYLEAIGAVQGVSDAVAGSMCWCPITGLDSADAAYEWNMGASRTGLSAEDQQLSDELASSFAAYINHLGIKDEDGNVLTLEESADGNYQAGTYYNYMKGIIETSLNNFLADTAFPYDSSASTGKGMMGGMGTPGGMRGPEGMADGLNGKPGTDATTGEDKLTAGGENIAIEDLDNINRQEAAGSVTLSGTYETAQDYINALNENGTWITYDEASNTASITSIADFAKAVKPASKGLGAFDQLDEGQGENTLFGYGDGQGAHFDAMLAEILKGTDYESAYEEDLTAQDVEGNTVDYRLNMYSPLYFLMPSNEGYETSNVAKYWRIRSGAWQGDTALTTEVNLALALDHYEGVEDVDFATVWGQKHTQAERTGEASTNFIDWVNTCLASEK